MESSDKTKWQKRKSKKGKLEEEPKEGGLFHGSETTIPPGIGRR